MRGLVRIRIVKSMVKKEFAQALRDPRMRGILFGTPVLMLIIFGYAVNTDVKDISMAVLDEDKTAMSRGLIEQFTASRYFKLYSYAYSEKEAEPLMNRGRIDAFIHIKKGLSKKVKTGGSSEIQIIIDGTDSNKAAIITAYVNEIMQNFFTERYFDRVRREMLYRLSELETEQPAAALSTGFSMTRGVRIKERAFFNPQLVSRNFFLPGIIGFIVSLITIMLTSMSIVKERESGTMEQIVVSPIRPREFIVGKTIPFVIIGFVDMVLVTVIAIFWFGVPFKGNILFLFLAGLFYILSTLSVGIYISTISRTQQQAMMSFFFFFIPAMLFSGFVFPVYAMPETIQAITHLNPLMYFIIIIRGVFLKGVGAAVLWKEMLALLVFGILLLNISVRRLSRRLE